MIDDVALPELMLQHHSQVQRLLAACRTLPPMPTAVVAPEEENSLLGALAGARENLIIPILIGDAAKIRALSISLSQISMIGPSTLAQFARDGRAS